MKRLVLVSLLACACSSKPPVAPAAPAPAPAAPTVAPAPSAIDAAIAAPDRTDADRALDAGRKPAPVLAYFRIAPGQHVGELFAGGGYTTELLARTVGPTGKVYAQNDPIVLEKF